MPSSDQPRPPYPEYPFPDAQTLEVCQFLKQWGAACTHVPVNHPRFEHYIFIAFDGTGTTLYSATEAELGGFLRNKDLGNVLYDDLKNHSPYGSRKHIWTYVRHLVALAACVGMYCNSMLLWIPFAVLMVFWWLGSILLLRTGDDSRIPEFLIYRPWFNLIIANSPEPVKQPLSDSRLEKLDSK